MADAIPHGSAELDRLVQASGENNKIDAKGPIAWDNAANSASLTKDFAAFANSRDGGVIVVGKSETSSGEFEFTGLSEEQASSFDTTKVAQWVNQRFNPPIRLVCYKHPYEGKLFVVITVREFDEVPVLCVKSYQDPANSKKSLLCSQTIYVRNANAECAPLSTVEEMRELIGLATLKQGDRLLTMFDSLLKGRSLLGVPSDYDQFNDELLRIEESLGAVHSDQVKAGAWRLVFRPTKYDELRWTDMSELESIVDRCGIKLVDTFPPSQRGTHPREWGIANEYYGEVWTLSSSGLFIHVEAYRENSIPYEATWRPAPPSVPAGQWLEFGSSLRHIFEMVAFAARLCDELQAGEGTELYIQATGLRGRKLLTSTFSVAWEGTDECKAHSYQLKKQLSVEELKAEWRIIAADTMAEFVNYFPHAFGYKVGRKTMLDWVDKFEKRDFR